MSTEQVVFNEGIIRAVNTKNFFIYFPMEGKHEVTSGRLTKVTIPRLPKKSLLTYKMYAFLSPIIYYSL